MSASIEPRSSGSRIVRTAARTPSGSADWADEACMVRFLKIAFVALAAVVLLGFAFANRHFVTVSFDPFASGDNAALSIAAPLFAVASSRPCSALLRARSRPGCRKGATGGPRAKAGSRRTNGEPKPRRSKAARPQETPRSRFAARPLSVGAASALPLRPGSSAAVQDLAAAILAWRESRRLGSLSVSTFNATAVGAGSTNEGVEPAGQRLARLGLARRTRAWRRSAARARGLRPA